MLTARSELVTPLSLACLFFVSACLPSPSDEPSRLLDRQAFNLAAQQLDLPLLWLTDEDGDGVPRPEEIVTLDFFATRPEWVKGGRLTPDFEAAVAAIEREIELPGGEVELAPEESERRRLVRLELDQGRPTLVQADLSELSPADRDFLEEALAAGELVDRLYARQLGIESMSPAEDAASRSLFRRNWGPRCVAPRTQDEPLCTASPGVEMPVVDVYPSSMQAVEGFCAGLDPSLTGPFTVVRERDGELVAVPYFQAYSDLMGEIAGKLRGAAAAYPEGEESALVSYLEAAAIAFETDDWEAADEAWAAMNAHNSRWYLRIAPDETYWEPCSLKAGFHQTLALIDPASLSWQERLDPLRAEMEALLAEISGPPYEAREVDFQLPDFLELLANFGDDRSPLGGTAGQSLPNWGPVANEGRGRTMAVANLGRDPDSRQTRREQLASLVDATTLAAVSEQAPKAEAELLDTILHEAAHNLGPAHEYEVGGQTDNEVFGGSLATILEELKSQIFGLRLVEFLRERGVIDQLQVHEVYLGTFAWCTRHIARGMVTGDGVPRAYSQLAAIEIGFLLDDGALVFDPEAVAANGVDRGVFVFDFERLPEALDRLAREVGSIKAQGLAERAEELRSRYSEGPTVPFELIAERIQRHPDMSFVYSVR